MGLRVIIEPGQSEVAKRSHDRRLAQLEMKKLTVLKLGGSAITDKSRDLTPDLVTIHQSIDQLVGHKEPLILLHGGGSFAHPFAKRARLAEGYRNDRNQLKILSETELYLDQLSRIIQVAMLQRGLNFVPLRPMSYLETRDGKVSNVFLRPFSDALRLGLIPLSHGDIVLDSKIGFSIASADRLASLLAIKFRASRVLFGSDVPGISASDPKNKSEDASIVREVNRENYSKVRRMLGRPSDATGGMLAKFDEAVKLARRGCETIIFNLREEAALGKLLSGPASDLSCTSFKAWKKYRR